MRTSRIQAITSSVFRNSRQYLQTNEKIFRLLDQGEENRQKSGDHSNEKEKQEKASQKQNAPLKLSRTNGKGVIVKGIHSDAYSIAVRHNSLLKKSAKLNHLTKKSQISTYRSSI